MKDKHNSDEDQGSDALGDSQQSTITTANGVFGYSNDWDGVTSASDPALAAARLLHSARQMTDTSRWWTMRWPSNAVSLLGRAGNLSTGQTYDLLKKLWRVSAEFSEQLWQETVIRRKELLNHGERDDVRQQWAECKRRLGSTGRNNKQKLMPSWLSVSHSPLYKIKAQLVQWLKVRKRRVAPNGQRTLDGFITRSAASRESAGVARALTQPRTRPPALVQTTLSSPSQSDAARSSSRPAATTNRPTQPPSRATPGTRPTGDGLEQGARVSSASDGVVTSPASSPPASLVAPRPPPGVASGKRKRPNEEQHEQRPHPPPPEDHPAPLPPPEPPPPPTGQA